MISNSSPPRTTPLTPLNNSPYSRGSRAVHQGQKKAKAYNVSVAEPDSEMSSVISKDVGKDGDVDKVAKPNETSPTPDSTVLTPSSKGILKRKREAEMDLEESGSASCSKKKVIFANPIVSATKIIDNVLARKTTRRRRLRYEDLSEESMEVAVESRPGAQPEPESVAAGKIADHVTLSQSTTDNLPNQDSENSDPKGDAKTRKNTKIPVENNNRDNLKSAKSTSSQVKNQAMNPESVNTTIELSKGLEEPQPTNMQVSSKDANVNSEIVFDNLESLLKAIESPCANDSDVTIPSSNQFDLMTVDDASTESDMEVNDNADMLVDNNAAIPAETSFADQVETNASVPFETNVSASIENNTTVTHNINATFPADSNSIEPTEINAKSSTDKDGSESNENKPVDSSLGEIKKTTEPEDVFLPVSASNDISPGQSKTDEEITKSGPGTPLLESWINVKKSVDLFLQSYCNMFTSKMRNWLSVKGISTIGDLASFVGASTDCLAESPICPLNEETIISVFQFMREAENKESSAFKLKELKVEETNCEKIKEDIKEAGNETNEIKLIQANGVIDLAMDTKLTNLKVVLKSLPTEFTARIGLGKTQCTSEYFDGLKNLERSLPKEEENECMSDSDATIDLSFSDEDNVISGIENSVVLPNSKPQTDSSTRKDDPQEVSATEKPPKRKSNGKATTDKSSKGNRTSSKKEPVEKKSPPDEPAVKEKPAACRSPFLTKSFILTKKVGADSECKPKIDPLKIVPRASIVIKRLTDNEIDELSKPSMISIEVSQTEIINGEDENSDIAASPLNNQIEDNNHPDQPSSMINSESPKEKDVYEIIEPNIKPNTPTKDQTNLNTPNVPSPARKSARKRQINRSLLADTFLSSRNRRKQEPPKICGGLI